jgi:dTDP-4-dehydrorhamnose reductase
MSYSHDMKSNSVNNENTTVIVLTGASGFLGQHCLQDLLEGHPSDVRVAGDKIVVYALHQTSPELEVAISSFCNDPQQLIHNNVEVVVVSLDLTSAEECQTWFSSLRSSSVTIDCCIHTAAMSTPTACENNPDLAMTVNVPRIFFDALYENNQMIKVIALSTDQVYDGLITAQPYNELSTCEPCNVYGKTKIEMEKYLLDQQKRRFPNSSLILLRSSIILGPRAPFLPDKAHSTFLHFCQSRMNCETTYYIDEIRSVIAVLDVVRIIIHMITMTEMSPPTSGVYCMGGPHPVNRHDMAVAVLSYFQVATDVAIPVKKVDVPVVPGTVKSPLNISMDSTKLLSTTGLLAFQPLPDIVAQTFLPVKP